MSKRILVADKFPESRLETLRRAGHLVEYRPELSADELPAALDDFQILVVRSTRVTAEAIRAGASLELIVRAGSGTNTIDKRAAYAAGKRVCNCPGKNAVAVAELTMGLMLAADRRIPQCTAELKARRWNKKEFSRADGIKGKTLGIVGMGAIGREVAKRALAFEMRVTAYDVVDFSVPGVERIDDLDELLRQADVVSLHVPLTDETHHLLDERRIALLKDSVILINTSRGEVIDEKALVEAVKARGLRVAVDVFEFEPAAPTGTYEGELALLDTVIATHHIGASTNQAQLAVADEVVAIVEQFDRDGTVRNEVRPD